MFETVAPDAFAKRDRHVFYETLPASIAIHAIAAAAITVGAMTRIAFPTEPPKLVVGYITAELASEPVPPPPPAALGQPKAPKPEPTLQTLIPVALTQDMAPTTIPDEIPNEMPLPSPMRLISATIDKFVPSAGVAGGVAGGVIGGSVGGALGGVLGGIVGGDGRLHFERDSRLPLFVEFQPFPEYPKTCVANRWEDTVVIKYVIGKDGLVHEVSITQRPYRKEFEAATIDAIKQWRFRPLLVDGEGLEVVHELTVYYKLY
jgi:protein TonB